MKAQIWKLIQNINQIWTNTKNIEDLNKYFHEDMTSIVGQDKQRIKGKKNCVEHWRKCSEKKIYSWKEYDEDIKVFDEKFAIVTYSFEIDLEREGKRITANSSDTFSLIKEGNEWKVISAVV